MPKHVLRVVFAIVHEGRFALCRFSKTVRDDEAPQGHGDVAMDVVGVRFMYYGTPSVRHGAPEVHTYNFVPVAPLQWVALRRKPGQRTPDLVPSLAHGSNLFPRIRRELEGQEYQLSFTDLSGRKLSPPPSPRLF